MALDVIVLSYADEINPSWKDISSAFPAARQLSISKGDVFKHVLNLVNTSQFWVIFPNMEMTAQELDFQPDDVEKKIINLFKSENSDEFSVALISRMYLVRLVVQRKLMTIFDIFSQDVKIHNERKGTDLNKPTISDTIYFTFDELTFSNFINVQSENYLQHVQDKIKTKFIWLVFPNMDLDEDEMVFMPDTYERTVINLFRAKNSDEFSAAYVSTSLLHRLISQGRIKSIFDLFSQSIKEHDKRKGHAYLDKHNKNLDIILLSYFEPTALDKFNSLHSKFGDRVKWVKDVKGIVNAHIQAAKISSTYSFYVVDADADILDSFNFDFEKTNNREYNAVFVWKSRNVLNGLEYGYGGVKLFNKFHFKNSLIYENGNIIDVTTSLGGIELVEEVACITKFNDSALSTWRSAFRECAKLSSAVIKGSEVEQNKEYLKVWTTYAEGDFAKYCLHGALAGSKFGEDNKNNKDKLNKINDFEWLESEFRSYFGL